MCSLSWKNKKESINICMQRKKYILDGKPTDTKKKKKKEKQKGLY